MRRSIAPALAGFFVLSTLVHAETLPEEAGERLAAVQARLANPANHSEYGDIAREAEEVIALAPEARAPRLLRIAALLKAGEQSAAAEELKRVAAVRHLLDEVQRIELRVLAARLAGKPLEELRFLAELQPHRADDRWLRYELARAHSELEQYGAAVGHIRAALELGGQDANWEGSWIHYLHSKAILRSGGDPREAIAAALAGRDERTTWRSTLYRLAMAQYAAGDEQGGRKSLDEYVEWARDEGEISDALVQVNLGAFFYELREYKQAEQHLRAALELDPQNLYGLWALAFVLIEKPGGLEEGVSLIDRGLALEPNDARLLDARGWALYRDNRAAEGYSWIRRAQLAHRGYDQRIVDHLAAVAAELKDFRRPPAPRAKWL